MKKMFLLFIVSLVLTPVNKVFAQEENYPIKVIVNNVDADFAQKCGNYNTDIVGDWHNQAVKYVLDNLLESGIKPGNKNFNSAVCSYLTSFCQTKGINVSVTFNGDFDTFVKEDINLCTEPTLMSLNAKDIMCRINSTLKDFTDERISFDLFTQKMESLRVESESLNSESEKKVCGLTAATAKHSMGFWKDNFDYYYAAFNGRHDVGSVQNSVQIVSGPCYLVRNEPYKRIPWWRIGASDVSGAYRGGRLGATYAGGLWGAIAGGLAGAGASSCVSLIGHAISELF
ncbi:MAG TPA: hypothetical protein PKA77_12455 [Chitinophagaceae bacterium]|nr:hypothetical protein [Chitinophagaceae bacterium]HMU59131.1 hypothetical protein [Chitinophagaceae bacterium]